MRAGVSIQERCNWIINTLNPSGNSLYPSSYSIDTFFLHSVRKNSTQQKKGLYFINSKTKYQNDSAFIAVLLKIHFHIQ